MLKRVKMARIMIGMGAMLAVMGCGPAAIPDPPEAEGDMGVVMPGAPVVEEAAAGGPAGGQEGQEQDGPAPTATFLPAPTFTPAPPGWVKPTPLPTYTPWPTFPPLPTEDPNAMMEQGASAPEPTKSAATVTEEVREMGGPGAGPPDIYLAKVKVKSHRTVQPATDVNWPAGKGELMYVAGEVDGASPWRRTKLEVKENYYGTMPQDYEILSWPEAANMRLEVGQEYIALVLAAYAAEGEFPGAWGGVHLNAEQLRAFGGPAGFLYMPWIIEGSTAWRLPDVHLFSGADSGASDLAAAKAGGDSMAVTDLVAAMKAGLP